MPTECISPAQDIGPLPMGHPTITGIRGDSPEEIYSEIRLLDDWASPTPTDWTEITDDGQPLRAAEGDILISFR
ncbi:MAG: hypothetical protein Q4D79_14535 [Propionibacteriaceae bacterium]|nr:hypothetical protein [Propionibacteriaceae bacterium]